MMLLTTLAMIGLAIYSLMNNNSGLAIILGLFGFIGGSLAIVDVLRYKNGLHHPKEWILEHLGRMCGAYIATFTAFAVTNLTAFLSGLLLWVLPAILGGFGIGIATNYYRKQFNIPKKNKKAV